MRKVMIIGNGTIKGTQVMDFETGEIIRYVQEICLNPITVDNLNLTGKIKKLV